MNQVKDESIWLKCPDFAQVFIRGEAFEGLDPAGEDVGYYEVRKLDPSLFVAVVVEAFECCVLDRAVHAFDPLPGRRLLGIAQREPLVQGGLDRAVLYPDSVADYVETHWPRIDCVPVLRRFGELDAISR